MQRGALDDVALVRGAEGWRHDNGDGAGDAFFAWQYPLHSGKALGLTGRLLVFAAGAVTASLCVTGSSSGYVGD